MEKRFYVFYGPGGCNDKWPLKGEHTQWSLGKWAKAHAGLTNGRDLLSDWIQDARVKSRWEWEGVTITRTL